MKFYGIYKIRRKDNSLIELPSLFAFTNNKERYEEFVEERNMDMFYVKKKDVDKSFYNKFLNHNKPHELAYQELYTRNQFDPTKKTKIRILSTWKEVENIVLQSDMVFKEMAKYISPSIYTINTSFLESLNDLGYIDVCRFMCYSFPDNLSTLFDGLQIDYDYDDRIYYEVSNIDYDEFALFMFFNGYTFK